MAFVFLLFVVGLILYFRRKKVISEVISSEQRLDEIFVEQVLQGLAKKRDALRRELLMEIIELLHNQVPFSKPESMYDDKYQKLPTAVFDTFSIGYIAGFIDSFLQSYKIELDVTGIALATIGFVEFYGIEQGPVMFRRVIDLQEEGNEEIMKAMSVGGNEFLKWGKANKDSRAELNFEIQHHWSLG